MEQAEKAEMKLIISSILPINIPISLYEETRIQYIKEINYWLKLVSKDGNLIYVDYYQGFVNPTTGRIKDGITYDGLHPIAIGYHMMAEILRTTLGKHSIKI